MQRCRDGASGPHTIRSYLTPERCWALPLHCPDIKGLHVLFDQAVA